MLHFLFDAAATCAPLLAKGLGIWPWLKQESQWQLRKTFYGKQSPLPREPSPAPLLGRGELLDGTDQSPPGTAVFAMHKPLTAESAGFFFSSDCPIYKYKPVSFKNLFHFNHLFIYSVAVSKNLQLLLQLALERAVLGQAPREHLAAWLPGTGWSLQLCLARGQPGLLWADVGLWLPKRNRESTEQLCRNRCGCVCRTAQGLLVHLCWSTKPRLTFGAREEREEIQTAHGEGISISLVCVCTRT